MRLLTEDPQEIWDITVNYFKTARSQCMSDNGWGCAYENTRGQRCVVGNLLVAETADDERSLREFSGSWEQYFAAIGVPWPKPKVAEMLTMFQTIHDGMYWWKEGGVKDDLWRRLNIAADVWGFEHVPVS